jgi:hypothetical protein
MKILSVLFLTFIIQSNYAGIFKISNRSFSSSAIETQGNALLDQLETSVNNNLPQVDSSGYLKSSSNASITAGAGVGADYQNSFSLFMVGVQGGLGINPGKLTLNNALKEENFTKIKGVGAQGAVMGGVNLSLLPMDSLGPISFSKSKLFVHFLPIKKSFDTITIKTLDVGMHYQYSLIDEVSATPLFRWNGLSFTTGLKYIRTQFSYKKTISGSTQYTVLGTNTTASYSGLLDTSATLKLWSIPLELSSAIRLLYIWQLFGGVGTDLSFGSASGIATLKNGTLTTSPSVVSGTP